LEDEQAATWLAEASLRLGAAAQAFAHSIEALCSASGRLTVEAAWRDLYRVEVMGNWACAASAALCTPRYDHMVWRLRHLAFRSGNEA
jgi:hypothetical protein